MKSLRLESLLAVITIMTAHAAAFAVDTGGGHAEGTPAPIAGIGIGALVAVSAGYRSLKRRLNR